MLFLAINSQIPNSRLGPTMLQNLKFPIPNWVAGCVEVSQTNYIESNFREDSQDTLEHKYWQPGGLPIFPGCTVLGTVRHSSYSTAYKA